MSEPNEDDQQAIDRSQIVHHVKLDKEIQTSDRASTATMNIQSTRYNSNFHNVRYFVIVMCGLAMGLMLLQRLTITVAMITMVNRTALYIMEHPNSTDDDIKKFFPEGYIETGDFPWTNEIQQTILSGYMVAYTIPQYFTTKLVMRHGHNKGIPISLSICAISNMLTPFLSHYGWQFALALRLMNGIGGSAVLPSMIDAIERWLPHDESAIGIAVFQFTANVLYATTPLISGFLTSIHWNWAFHIPSSVALIFSLFWYLIIADTPESSKLISLRELNLINGLDENRDDNKQSNGKSSKKVSRRFDLPWFFMFKLKEFYSLTFVWCLQCASMGGFLFLLPSYMNRILQVPVEEIGRVSFYVQIGTMFCMLWPHPATNFFQELLNLSLTSARIIVIFICEFIVCLTFGYLGLFHNNLILTICVNRFFHMTVDTLVMSTVMSQYGHAGVSGLVYSMINTIGNLTTVFFCWFVGRLLDYTGETLECWSWVMVAMVVMNFLYFVIYAAFCSSTPVEVPQPKKEVEDGCEK